MVAAVAVVVDYEHCCSSYYHLTFGVAAAAVADDDDDAREVSCDPGDCARMTRSMEHQHQHHHCHGVPVSENGSDDEGEQVHSPLADVDSVAVECFGMEKYDAVVGRRRRRSGEDRKTEEEQDGEGEGENEDKNEGDGYEDNDEGAPTPSSPETLHPSTHASGSVVAVLP